MLWSLRDRNSNHGTLPLTKKTVILNELEILTHYNENIWIKNTLINSSNSKTNNEYLLLNHRTTPMTEIEFILYVKDQAASRDFYAQVLQMEPHLDVPGMTEFLLSQNVKLGLMPETGIAKIISGPLPHPQTGAGIPRCELYLKVPNASAYLQRGMNAEAMAVSSLQMRDWGDQVGYIADPDGHVIAFAEADL